MSTHPEPQTLSAFLDGEVGGAERAEVERHIASCASCAATSRRLSAASSRLASLGPVKMTADEHRALRQAVLGSRTPAPVRRGLRLGRLQWALAGGFGVIFIAALGFAVIHQGTSHTTSDQTLTQALAPAQMPPAPYDFKSNADIERTVKSLPEVAAALNQSAEDAGGAALAPAPTYAPPGNAPPAASGNAAQAYAAPNVAAKALPRTTTTTADNAARQSSAAESAPVPANAFSNQAADGCLSTLAAAQAQPMVPLLAREARFKGEPAWLLVYAAVSTPGSASDQIDTWLVRPADCAALTGNALNQAVLTHTSFSGR